MKEQRVVIVGAGIGGLTAALALSDRGHGVTLVERRTGFGETGAGIQISPNASRVLIALGLGGSLARIAAEPRAIAMRGLRRGRLLAELPLGSMRTRFGAPYLVVARAALHTALLDAVRARGGIRLLVGRTLVAARDAAEAAEIDLDAGGGRESFAADLVVGADGLWSAVRPALGDARPPVFRGHVASRALVPAEHLPPGIDPGVTSVWLGSGRHVVCYALAGGRTVNVVVVEARPERLAGWSEPESGAALSARFADAARPLRDLLAIPESWAAWSLYDRPPGRMAGRRIALLGDAAHPVLPFLAQGGALAIEDAADFAARLSAAVSVPTALDAYARAREPRTARVQAAARRNGRIYHLGGPAAFARDLVLARSDPARLMAGYDWLYGWRPDAA